MNFGSCFEASEIQAKVGEQVNGQSVEEKYGCLKAKQSKNPTRASTRYHYNNAVKKLDTQKRTISTTLATPTVVDCTDMFYLLQCVSVRQQVSCRANVYDLTLNIARPAV